MSVPSAAVVGVQKQRQVGHERLFAGRHKRGKAVPPHQRMQWGAVFDTECCRDIHKAEAR